MSVLLLTQTSLPGVQPRGQCQGPSHCWRVVPPGWLLCDLASDTSTRNSLEGLSSGEESSLAHTCRDWKCIAGVASREPSLRLRAST